MFWIDKWTRDDYLDIKQNNFHIVDEYLRFEPKQILDIGCGLAIESELFQKKYGTKLYLLDGNSKDNNQNQKRFTRFGKKENFAFYNTIDYLESSYESRNMDYNFVDANNIKIDSEIKFDLVYSFLSCGFHYDLDTYKDLIISHTTPDSTIIIDFRTNTLDKMTKDLATVEIIEQNKKHTKCSIKFY